MNIRGCLALLLVTAFWGISPCLFGSSALGAERECLKFDAMGDLRYVHSDNFYRLSEDIVTPHIPWARSLAGGSIRALFVAPRYSHRETVELAQRLSLDYDVIMLPEGPDDLTPPNRSWIWGCDPEDALREWRQKLAQHWDVIVLGDCRWAALPDLYRSHILQQVENGCGLVLVYQDAKSQELLVADLEVAISQLAASPSRGAGAPGRHSGTAASAACSCLLPRILATVPLAHIPGLAEAVNKGDEGEPLLACRTLGAGRIAVLDYVASPERQHPYSLTPPSPRDRTLPAVLYDYYHSLVAKTVVWAAGRTAPVAVSQVGDGFPEPISARDLAKTGLKITVDNRGERREALLEVVARRWNGTVDAQAKSPVTLPPGRSEHVIALPRLSGGRHFVDVWLRDPSDEAVLEWASCHAQIVPHAEVASIALSQPSFAAGERVAATVTVRGSVEGAVLVVQLTDSFGRLLAAERRPLDGPGAVAVQFPFDNPVAIQHEVVAELRDQVGLLDRASTLFALADLKYHDFAFVLWAGLGNNAYRQRMIAQQAHRLGVDSSYGYGKPLMWDENPIAYWTTRAGLSQFFYACYMGGRLLLDPKEEQGFRDTVGRLAEVNRHLGGIGYSTGDEYALPAYTTAKWEWKADELPHLRRWLEARYETLERLNQVWRTDFKSWDEVRPYSIEEAREANTFAPWSDGWYFLHFTFADAHRKLRDEVEKYDPDAPVGEEGMFDADPYAGVDWELFRTAATLLHGYERPVQDEHIRSLAPPGALTGYWFGSYYNRDYSQPKMRWHPWHALLNGFNSAWWWTADIAYSTWPDALAPDLTPLDPFKWTMEEVREIKSGVGRLLLDSQRDHDGIALLYSMPSYLANAAFPLRKEHLGLEGREPAFMETKYSWQTLLEDLGLQYQYLSEGDIARGALDTGDYRVMILPASQAVTEQTARALERFVRGGGLLLADIWPAVVDEWCNPLEKGLLDDLFGVRRSWVRAEDRRKRPVRFRLPDGSEVDFPHRYVDHTLRAAAGRPRGEACGIPFVIERHLGRGRAVLLNFYLGDYYTTWHFREETHTDLRFGRWGEVLRALLRGVLEESDLRARVSVTSEGRPLLGCEPIFFSRGENRYLALEYKPDIIYFVNGDIRVILDRYDYEIHPDVSPRPLRIRLHEKSHVYDLRQGRYLGFTSDFESEIAPGEAKVFSLLPHRVAAISLEAPERARRGEVARFGIALTVSEGRPGRHCFHLEAANPKGDKVRCYAQNAIGENGRAQFEVPFALNDDCGGWRLIVRDVATGLMAEAPVHLHD